MIKMYKSLFILVLILFGYLQAKSQEQIITQEDTFYLTKTVIVDGDTIPNVMIEEVVVFPKLVFKSRRQSRRYRKLVRDVTKAYPYAKYAKLTLDKMESEYAKLETEKEKKNYIKLVEKELTKEFGEELKKLTVTQGRILLKLIDRETGDTSYELLKELRGSVSAFFWQAIARLFGSDLKAQYDPKGDDILTERVVRMIETGQIKLDRETLKRLNMPY